MSQVKKKKTFLHADEQSEEGIRKFKLSDMASFKKLLHFARPYKSGIIFGLSLMVVSSLTSLISARMMGLLVENGLLKKSLSTSFNYSGLVIVFEVLSLGCMWQGRKLLTDYSSQTILSIREALFNHLQNLPIGFYDRQPQGRIVTRVTHDVEGIEEFFTSSMGRVLNSAFMALMAMMAMLVTDFRLGGILVISVFPAIFFVYVTRDYVRKVNRNLSRTNSALNSKLSEFLSGIEVIRIYGLENWSKEEYDSYVDEYRTSHLNANNLYAWTRPLVALLCSAPLIGLVWYGGNNILTGAMTVGLFVTFVRYCERFFNPIMTLAREIHMVQQAFTSAERVASFLAHAEEDTVLGEDGKLAPKGMEGSIEFNDVWMAYDSKNYVLKGIDFKIRKGEKIGLVGTTGCGKTTTVSLLSRLYEYQKGDILLDGHSLRSYQRSFLRQQIGFVSQDAILFRGSFRQNLCTDESVPDDKVLYACEVTGLARVMRLGSWTLDSEIFDGGANLSVGERQLLALTRVLIKNPTILILDEATANIDPWFEKIIHQAVDRVMVGRTCLMIAHRLSTLDHCDRIFVFEKGQLVEEGSKSELEEKKGHFFNLHQAQEAVE
ncbi:MAG: ABC transporter ATP-binding protein/permease [Bacteriovoracaceae bacterium]|nr:ABC transporter ATP-binding protein/permease [Bacteriovoracaceae bacterium]